MLTNRNSVLKRARLIEAARRLAHAKGFSPTTLAEVAAQSGVPLGNVYYYFRTKQALGEAIVDELADHYRAQRRSWESAPDPVSRLLAWVHMVEQQREALARSGCPVGTLCSELGKTSPTLGERAQRIFADLLEFATQQFRELGRTTQAADDALHLLVSLQGASLLAHAFNDDEIVRRETETLREWLADLGSPAQPKEREPNEKRR